MDIKSVYVQDMKRLCIQTTNCTVNKMATDCTKCIPISSKPCVIFLHGSVHTFTLQYLQALSRVHPNITHLSMSRMLHRLHTNLPKWESELRTDRQHGLLLWFWRTPRIWQPQSWIFDLTNVSFKRFTSFAWYYQGCQLNRFQQSLMLY